MTSPKTPEVMKEEMTRFLQDLKTKFPEDRFPEFWFCIPKNIVFFQNSIGINQLSEIENLLPEKDRKGFKEFFSEYDFSN